MIFCGSTDRYCFTVSLLYELVKRFIIISGDLFEHNHARGEFFFFQNKVEIKIGHEQAIHSDKMSAHASYAREILRA